MPSALPKASAFGPRLCRSSLPKLTRHTKRRGSFSCWVWAWIRISMNFFTSTVIRFSNRAFWSDRHENNSDSLDSSHGFDRHRVWNHDHEPRGERCPHGCRGRRTDRLIVRESRRRSTPRGGCGSGWRLSLRSAPKGPYRLTSWSADGPDGTFELDLTGPKLIVGTTL